MVYEYPSSDSSSSSSSALGGVPSVQANYVGSSVWSDAVDDSTEWTTFNCSIANDSTNWRTSDASERSIKQTANTGLTSGYMYKTFATQDWSTDNDQTPVHCMLRVYIHTGTASTITDFNRVRPIFVRLFSSITENYFFDYYIWWPPNAGFDGWYDLNFVLDEPSFTNEPANTNLNNIVKVGIGFV